METGRLDTGGAPARVTATHAAGHTVDLEMTLGLRAQQGRPVGAVASLRPAGPRPPITDYAATGE